MHVCWQGRTAGADRMARQHRAQAGDVKKAECDEEPREAGGQQEEAAGGGVRHRQPHPAHAQQVRRALGARCQLALSLGRKASVTVLCEQPCQPLDDVVTTVVAVAATGFACCSNEHRFACASAHAATRCSPVHNIHRRVVGGGCVAHTKLHAVHPHHPDHVF